MNSTYIPSCLRNQPKQKAKPRKQAIKEAKAEVIDKAINLDLPPRLDTTLS